MPEGSPRLLLIAHGTRFAPGVATVRRLADAVRAARPGLRVDLCFLDIVEPSLPQALDAWTGLTVALPLLLTTGYHVQTDIPAAVSGREGVVVARHLGPDPLLAAALSDRLAEAGGNGSGGAVWLVAAGSSRPDAADELAEMGRLLAGRVGREVLVRTMADDLVGAVRGAAGPVDVATYLLAEGQFLGDLAAAVADRGTVAAPLGSHPAVVELVLRRYDQATRGE